jgi:hypothetical protein
MMLMPASVQRVVTLCCTLVATQQFGASVLSSTGKHSVSSPSPRKPPNASQHLMFGFEILQLLVGYQRVLEDQHRHQLIETFLAYLRPFDRARRAQKQHRTPRQRTTAKWSSTGSYAGSSSTTAEATSTANTAPPAAASAVNLTDAEGLHSRALLPDPSLRKGDPAVAALCLNAVCMCALEMPARISAHLQPLLKACFGVLHLATHTDESEVSLPSLRELTYVSVCLVPNVLSLLMCVANEATRGVFAASANQCSEAAQLLLDTALTDALPHEKDQRLAFRCLLRWFWITPTALRPQLYHALFLPRLSAADSVSARVSLDSLVGWAGGVPCLDCVRCCCDVLVVVGVCVRVYVCVRTCVCV